MPTPAGWARKGVVRVGVIRRGDRRLLEWCASSSDCEFEDGMSICVGNIVTDDEMYDVKLPGGEQRRQGAWGAALLNAEYWHWLTESTRRPRGTRQHLLRRGRRESNVDYYYYYYH